MLFPVHALSVSTLPSVAITRPLQSFTVTCRFLYLRIPFHQHYPPNPLHALSFTRALSVPILYMSSILCSTDLPLTYGCIMFFIRQLYFLFLTCVKYTDTHSILSWLNLLAYLRLHCKCTAFFITGPHHTWWLCRRSWRHVPTVHCVWSDRRSTGDRGISSGAAPMSALSQVCNYSTSIL